MLVEFFQEERAQGAIEYILLAGGIIASTIMVFNLYIQIASNAADSLNRSVANASSETEKLIQQKTAEMAI